ncbi:MAG: UDP-galactopyranose mutase [bacterium]|nr:UDP-galactopyranose mutase [bacterium]
MNVDGRYDIVIVGAGISGATLAERYATQLGKRVLVLEKRGHVGGNCHDYINDAGIRVAKYGPHYFRTNDEGVWRYVQSFSSWEPFVPKALSHVNGVDVPIPVNIHTVNALFGTNIETEEQMKAWLEAETDHIIEPKNSEEAALRRIGKRLYELMFKNYTTKQWDMSPCDLDPSVMDRIPVRLNHDDRYFTDKYQMYPTEGYSKIFERMLSNPLIEVRTNSSWESLKDAVGKYEKLFFTGTIDSYFDDNLGKLEYRSLRFEEQTLDQEWYQKSVQVNYPSLDVPFTRIVEYKHQTRQSNPRTTIVREYPTWDGEPYYPVASQKNKEIYERYQKKAEALEGQGIYFVGRLANYKYFNMDQAFRNSLDLFYRLEPGTKNEYAN